MPAMWGCPPTKDRAGRQADNGWNYVVADRNGLGFYPSAISPIDPIGRRHRRNN